jgi:hypothetical protein
MRVGEGEGGPNLAEHPRLTQFQPPTLPISGEVAAGDREGPSSGNRQYPMSPSWPSPLRASRLIRPELCEPIRRQRRVSCRALQIPMPKVVRQAPRIMPIIRQLISRRMPEHVRMYREG